MAVEGTLHGFFAVVLRVATASDPEESLRVIVRALVEEMGFAAAIVRLSDPEGETADGEAAFQYGVTGNDVDGGENEEGMGGELAVPIEVHGVPRGVLRVYTAEEHRFTDEERELLSTVAQLSGELIERSRREQALQAIMRDLSSTLDAEEVVDRLLRHTVEGLHFSGAVLRLLEEETGELLVVGARGLSDEYLRAGERRADDPAASRVLAGERVIIHDLAAEGGLPYTQAALDEGIRSVLSVPLWSRGRARGVLRVYSKRVRRFDSHEVRFVQLVAELGALALMNAHLHGLLAERVEELGAEASGWYQYLALS